MSFRWEQWCKWFSWLRMQHFFEFLKVSFRSTLCLGELLSGNGKRYSCHLYVFQCIIIFSDNKIDSRESENACVNSAQCSKTRKTLCSFSFFFFTGKPGCGDCAVLLLSPNGSPRKRPNGGQCPFWRKKTSLNST